MSTSFVQLQLIASSSLALFSLGQATTAAPIDPCVLPRGLDSTISAKFPGAHVAHLADLQDDDKKFFQKDHGSHCPGLVRVNFYGDGKPTWALVLVSGQNQNSKSELIVARKLESDWDIRSITGGSTSGTPVVWREPPGKYESVWGDKPIHARNPVIVYCGYESWMVVYAWNGKAIEKVQMLD
jgi:hypothetical protein